MIHQVFTLLYIINTSSSDITVDGFSHSLKVEIDYGMNSIECTTIYLVHIQSTNYNRLDSSLSISADNFIISSGNWILLPCSAPIIFYSCVAITPVTNTSWCNIWITLDVLIILHLIMTLLQTQDGSCVAVVNGCTDSNAFNYDSSASTGGSCIAVVNGFFLIHYNSSANIDDGSCIAVVNGCTDSTAFNYDFLQTQTMVLVLL